MIKVLSGSEVSKAACAEIKIVYTSKEIFTN